jgi:hypothetical protein
VHAVVRVGRYRFIIENIVPTEEPTWLRI